MLSAARYRFIILPVFIAVLTTLSILIFPKLFYPLLLIDLWLLAYHHVIATFSRLCFDSKSFSQYKWLTLGALPMVLLITAGIAWKFGLVWVFTIYFYWQWWHYTRQSWGIFRGYDLNSKQTFLELAHFYSLPVLGICARSFEGHKYFLSSPIYLFPIPLIAILVVAFLAIIFLAVGLFATFQKWSSGKANLLQITYLLSHHFIFAYSYLILRDITLGWLAINIWHNAQYVWFVWMFNRNRFSSGVDQNAKWMSYLSQPQNVWFYFLVMLGITAVAYLPMIVLSSNMVAAATVAIVIYQAVNFHHYIADSVVWKLRMPALKTILTKGNID